MNKCTGDFLERSICEIWEGFKHDKIAPFLLKKTSIIFSEKAIEGLGGCMYTCHALKVGDQGKIFLGDSIIKKSIIYKKLSAKLQ
jgi:hypothetical protein